MRVLKKAVCDEHGVVILIDIFIDDQWHGSRRTIRQCHDYLNFIRNRSKANDSGTEGE